MNVPFLRSCNDKPETSMGFPELDNWSIRRVLRTLSVRGMGGKKTLCTRSSSDYLQINLCRTGDTIFIQNYPMFGQSSQKRVISKTMTLVNCLTMETRSKWLCHLSSEE